MRRRKEFRLQTLLELRERTKKSAEEKFVASKNALDVEKKKLKDLEKTLREMEEKRKEKIQEYLYKKTSGTLTIYTIRAQEYHIDSLKKKEELLKLQIEEQKKDVEAAQEYFDACRHEMVAATQQYKILEKLRDNWELEEKRKIEHRENEQADEISQSQFHNKRISQ